jgi:DNA-binding CsgD family transcriptional regulator
MSDCNVAAHARHVMGQCGANSITLFVFGGAEGDSQVTYVHTIGVPEDVNDIYRKSIYRHDPFLASRRALCGRSAATPFVIDRARAESLCDPALLEPYQKLMQRFGYCESVAAFRSVTAETLLVAGLLRQDRGRNHRALAAATIGEDLQVLLERVASQVLQSAMRLYHRQAPASPTVDGHPDLTPRENDVVGHLYRGCSNKQIAARLGLSEFTIENNLRRIYRKFSVHNRTALMAAVGGVTSQGSVA